MARWPATEEALIEAGYILEPRVATCSRCPATVRWCTTPNKKKMPLTVIAVLASEINPKGGTLYQSHFADCPKADSFRKAR